ncbi:uncharacterized mitochondrial protein AtMg00810-like [Helianthus annuus]|uniref:uncharacterized mitochondrial protein AtMg00810-like n=1 Tax=Helianthus annuus TaxID=4232 RepID=UPI000B8FC2F2|nr:uncharacterized mitochondrial protein AtMg00810-like [Helianthus annuus]
MAAMKECHGQNRFRDYRIHGPDHVHEFDRAVGVNRNRAVEQSRHFLVYFSKKGNADIIITGSDPDLVQSFITRLHEEFSVKDLGALGYFWGLEVTYSDKGTFLSQAEYAHDILACASLLEAKQIATPLTTTETFSSNGDQFHDPTLYRSLVGALQYLTITRPDLSYAVNQDSQHLQSPTTAHFQSVKRILRYVKGTIFFGLTFSRPQKTTLVGYSDTDWARCIETGRSTYGYSIYFGWKLSILKCQEATYGLSIQL